MKCLNCGKELTGAQKKYCCHQCQVEYQNNLKIKAWQEGSFNGLKGESQLSDTIRAYLLKKAGYECEECGWGEINPYTGTVPLEIHHKDGDYRNNKEENLQVLCPNCHSLTEHYRGANKNGRPDRNLYKSRQNKCIDCGAPISPNAVRCMVCAGKANQKEVPVTREKLKELIRTTPFTTIGKQFGITDNAIKKWCKKYSLPYRKVDINKISDEDWQAI